MTPLVTGVAGAYRGAGPLWRGGQRRLKSNRQRNEYAG